MGYIVITAIFRETDVVSTGSDPDIMVFPGERRLPDAEMMAAGDHGNRFGHLVAEILLAVKEVQRAHRHGEVIFAAIGLDRGVECGHGVAGIGDMPRGRIERGLHIFLRTDNHEVDHVPEIVEFIVNTAGKAVDFLTQIGIERGLGGLQYGRRLRGFGGRG